mmetsp:Transcript_45956/g.72920  ORF Transcript_45956/g.72920 Transcript_45956/m.72920 type:complete len:247 (+) Transcript_45956:143-883(+)
MDEVTFPALIHADGLIVALRQRSSGDLAFGKGLIANLPHALPCTCLGLGGLSGDVPPALLHAQFFSALQLPRGTVTPPTIATGAAHFFEDGIHLKASGDTAGTIHPHAPHATAKVALLLQARLIGFSEEFKSFFADLEDLFAFGFQQAVAFRIVNAAVQLTLTFRQAGRSIGWRRHIRFSVQDFVALDHAALRWGISTTVVPVGNVLVVQLDPTLAQFPASILRGSGGVQHRAAILGRDRIGSTGG